MNFGAALDLLTAGHRIARQGWNGKGMFIYLVPEASYPAQRGAAKRWLGEGAMVPYQAYIAMKTADETVVPWLASQTDILATDWMSIEDEVIIGFDEGSQPDLFQDRSEIQHLCGEGDRCVDEGCTLKHPISRPCPAGAQCLSISCKLDHSAGAKTLDNPGARVLTAAERGMWDACTIGNPTHNDPFGNGCMKDGCPKCSIEALRKRYAR